MAENTNTTRDILTEINIDKGVGTIIFNRPHKGNSLSTLMVSQALEALDTFESDPAIRVIVITGSGKMFCTGMDLSATTQMDDSKNIKDVGLVFERLKNCKKPLIAKINGPAIGVGCGLLFTADIRIASKNAFFWVSDVQRGLIPAIISVHMSREIGSAFAAKRLLLTGQRISAEDFNKYGLLSELVEPDQLDNAVDKWVAILNQNGPTAMEKTKEHIRLITDGDCTHQENLNRAKRLFKEMVTSEEAQYGVSCFLEKKKPDWRTFMMNKAKL